MVRGLISLLSVFAALSATRMFVSDGSAMASYVPEHIGEPAPARTLRPPPRLLPFFYDLYTFRGSAGRTTVVASFSVPVENLEREAVSDDVRYRFDVTLVLADTVLRSVSRTDDSVFVSAPHALPGDHLLHTYIEVQAWPSPNTVERVIMSDATTPGIGQLYSAPFHIPDYRGSRLMLSDIVLGQSDSSADWKRGGVTLALLPTSRLPSSSFGVYYEVYNLPSGDRYDTEISVEHVDDSGNPVGDGNVVRTGFSGLAHPRPDGSLPELRTVGASLPQGRYRLTVTVTDGNTGEATTRSRLFQVSGWSRGATLVPALPWRRGTDPSEEQ